VCFMIALLKLITIIKPLIMKSFNRMILNFLYLSCVTSRASSAECKGFSFCHNVLIIWSLCVLNDGNIIYCQCRRKGVVKWCLLVSSYSQKIKLLECYFQIFLTVIFQIFCDR
jgi:hypothetical protein